MVLILTGPALQTVRGGRLLVPLVGGLIPIAGVYAVSDDRRHGLLALALGVAAVVTSILSLATQTLVITWTVLVFPLAFYAYVIWIVGSRVLGSSEVSADTLAGAACVYLLLGICWWFVYMALELAQPGSFTGLRPPGTEAAAHRIDLIYFSFVTLTTLGYGDITPATAQARAFTIIEAVTGVLYIAILVARLVGVYGSARKGS